MSEALTNFLVDLASDRGLMARFMANPESELNQRPERLTDEEKEAVKTGNALKIRSLLGVEMAAPNLVGGAAPKPKAGKKKGAKKPSPKKSPARKRKGGR